MKEPKGKKARRPKIGVAVIGCGYWGPNLIRNFQRSDHAELLWICDKDASRMTRVADDLQLDASLSTDYREILKDSLVNAVAIATPVTTHFALARDALKSGKHVLVEKPLAHTTKEAVTLVSLARRCQRILMVDYTFLFSSPILELKKILDRGELGKILYIHSTRVNLGIFQEDINVLWDLLPHDLSIIDALLPEKPLEVSVQAMAHINRGVEDVAFLTLYYENDIIAHFHVSWLDPCKIRRMTIVGDRKMAVYDDMDPNEPLRIYDKRIARAPYFSDFGEFKLHYRFGDIHSPRIEIKEPLRRVCNHFLDCIEKEVQPMCDGEAGRRIVHILELAERAMKYRGKVVLIRSI